MTDIELVIKIPEETHKDIIKNGFIYDEDNEVVTYAIKKGTPRYNSVNTELNDCISRQAVDSLSRDLVHATRDKADFLCNFWEGLRKLPPVKSQEPCDDCISRQTALDTIENWLACDDYNEAEGHIMRAMQSVLCNLPSVNPKEPKTGHWIWCGGAHKCSNCEEYTCFSHKELLRYCPNCGARMSEVSE